MKLLLALALVAIAAPAAAQTQAQMNRQAATAYTHADAAMTVQWRATLAAMKRRDTGDLAHGGGGFAAALLDSQRAWLRFRDTQCIVEAGRYAGGSAQSMVRTQCLSRLTDERTVQLRQVAQRR